VAKTNCAEPLGGHAIRILLAKELRVENDPPGDSALIKAREEREEADDEPVRTARSARRTVSVVLFLATLAAAALAAYHHFPAMVSSASSRFPITQHP
jgi:hypothetical protein